MIIIISIIAYDIIIILLSIIITATHDIIIKINIIIINKIIKV